MCPPCVYLSTIYKLYICICPWYILDTFEFLFFIQVYVTKKRKRKTEWHVLTWERPLLFETVVLKNQDNYMNVECWERAQENDHSPTLDKCRETVGVWLPLVCSSLVAMIWLIYILQWHYCCCCLLVILNLQFTIFFQSD